MRDSALAAVRTGPARGKQVSSDPSERGGGGKEACERPTLETTQSVGQWRGGQGGGFGGPLRRTGEGFIRCGCRSSETI